LDSDKATHKQPLFECYDKARAKDSRFKNRGRAQKHNIKHTNNPLFECYVMATWAKATW